MNYYFLRSKMTLARYNFFIGVKKSSGIVQSYYRTLPKLSSFWYPLKKKTPDTKKCWDQYFLVEREIRPLNIKQEILGSFKTKGRVFNLAALEVYLRRQENKSRPSLIYNLVTTWVVPITFDFINIQQNNNELIVMHNL